MPLLARILSPRAVAAITLLACPGAGAADGEGLSAAELGRRARAALPPPSEAAAVRFGGLTTQEGEPWARVELELTPVEAAAGAPARWSTKEILRAPAGKEPWTLTLEGLLTADLELLEGRLTREEGGEATVLSWTRTPTGYALRRGADGRTAPGEAIAAAGGLVAGVGAVIALARSLSDERAVYEFPALGDDRASAATARLEVRGLAPWDEDGLHRRALLVRWTLGAQTIDLALHPSTRALLGFRQDALLCLADVPDALRLRLPEWWAAARERPTAEVPLVREAPLDLPRGADERAVAWVRADGTLAWRTDAAQAPWEEASLASGAAAPEERARWTTWVHALADTRRRLLLRADGATPWRLLRPLLAAAASAPAATVEVEASVERRPDEAPERFGALPLSPYTLEPADPSETEVRAVLTSVGTGAARETWLAAGSGRGLVLPRPGDRRRAAVLGAFLTSTLLRLLGQAVGKGLEEGGERKRVEPPCYVDVASPSADEVPLEDVLALYGLLHAMNPQSRLLVGTPR